MMFLSALGEFPEMLLGLAFSLGCALLLGFLCLWVLMNLMTHHVAHDHNVINDANGIGSLLNLNAAVGVSDFGPSGAESGGATGGPYLIPAASPFNRFARDTESDAIPAGRVVELPLPVAGRIAQSWSGNGLNGNDAA